MRKYLRAIVPAAFLAAFVAIPAAAQEKIATVDLKKLFDNYYKTKLAQAAIDQRRTELANDDRSMTDDLKKRGDEYQKLLDSAHDQAVSDDERAKRRQLADDKLKELQDSKAAIEQFERQASTTLSDQRTRMRENIIAEIKKAVADKAKAADYTLVLDKAALSINETPAIIYDGGDNDLTDDVLKELNAGAPLDMPQTTPDSSTTLTNNLPYIDMPPGTSLPLKTSP